MKTTITQIFTFENTLKLSSVLIYLKCDVWNAGEIFLDQQQQHTHKEIVDVTD